MIRAFRDCQVVLAGGVSAIMLFLMGLVVIDPLAVSRQDVPALVAFGVSFAVALVLWTEGTRLIPASESGLLGNAETPFAILLAWLFLSELPPPAGFVGGAVVLAAVFFHAGSDLAQDTGLTGCTQPSRTKTAG
jgi:drug/metabolite transporter (DMT)-like permease